MEISGTVIFTDIQTGTSRSGKEWRKKIFVIEYVEGTYAKKLAFEMFGDDKINANPVEKGQAVTVQYDVESTEWNGRWFTTANAWRVSPIGAVVETTKVTATEVTNDDLPF